MQSSTITRHRVEQEGERAIAWREEGSPPPKGREERESEGLDHKGAFS